MLPRFLFFDNDAEIQPNRLNLFHSNNLYLEFMQDGVVFSHASKFAAGFCMSCAACAMCRLYYDF